MLNAMGIVISGCGIGFLCGVAFNDDQLAMNVMNFVIQYTYLLGGGYGNNKTRDIVDYYLQYASPCRYGAEIYYRIFADGHIPAGSTLEDALDFYGFDLGFHICFPALYAIGLIIISLGWVIIVHKNSPPKKKPVKK